MTCFTGLTLELTSTTRDVSSSLGLDVQLLRRVRALELSTARGRTALAAPDTPAPIGAASRHYAICNIIPHELIIFMTLGGCLFYNLDNNRLQNKRVRHLVEFG